MEQWLPVLKSWIASLSEQLSRPVVWGALAALIVFGVFGYWLATRTRLAKIPAIGKCVILSVLAHVFLIVYAYSTHWIRPLGLSGNEAWASVQMVDEAVESIEPEIVSDLRPNVNKFETQPELPGSAPLPQPLDDWDLEIQRSFDSPDWDAPTNAVEQENVPPMPSFIETLPLTTPPEIAAVFVPPLTTETPAADVNAAPSNEAMDTENIAPTELTITNPQPVAAVQPDIVQTPPAELGAATEKFVIDQFLKSSQRPLLEPRPIEKDVPDAPAAAVLPAALPPATNFAPVESVSPAKPKIAASASPMDPVRLADAQPIPKVYSLRDPEQRLQRAIERGGTPDTEKAVALGLQWLAKHQESDGRWNPRTTGGGHDNQVMGHQRPGSGVHSDTGISGLALLAFLAAGHTHLSGDYQDVVANGLQFLLNSQSEDGHLSGKAALYDRMYCHGIALLAISETLAATGDARLLEPVQRAVDYSVRSQHSTLGGWRYQPGDEGDMSQFGWQVMGLHSARLGGAVVPEKTIEGMRRFLHSCTRGTHRGLGCYRPGEGHNPTMTAEALLSRLLLEPSVSQQTRSEAIDYLSQYLPQSQQANYYYWYYGTMALHHAGGAPWQRWNVAMQQTLLAKQVTAGNRAGSWPADGVWSGYGGEVYSTAMATLCLEVYYRYRPAHEIVNGE